MKIKKIVALLLSTAMCMPVLTVQAAEDPKEVSVFLHVANEAWDNDVIFNSVEEKFNVDFDWIPCTYTELESTLGLLYSAGDLPDFFISITGNTSTFFRSLIDEELVWDLTPFIESGDYPNLSEYMATETFEYEMVDGKWYGIPRYYEAVQPSGIWYRKDWLDKLGLEEPTTVEEFADVLEKVVEADLDGTNTQGLTMNISLFKNASENFIQAFVGSTDWAFYEDTGLYEQYYVREEYRNYLSYMNDLYEKGLLDPDFISGADQFNTEKFAAGQAFACLYNIDANIVNPYYDTLLSVNPDAEVGILKPLTGANGCTATCSNDYYDGTMAISSSVDEETVKVILEMCDYLVSEEGRKMATYGLEGVHYTEDAEGNIERIQEAYDADIANCSNIWGLGIHRVNQLIEGYFSRGVRDTVDRYDLISAAYQANYDVAEVGNVYMKQFTSENLVNFESGVKDCVDQWRTSFITGTEDIDTDEAWAAYLEAVDQAGYYLIQDDANEWMNTH